MIEMKDNTFNLDVKAFVQSLGSWNDSENIGRIIRSLIEASDEWNNKSESKAIRKFICRYCPFVMDDLELMTGISESWRLEDIIRILKKQNLRGKELTSKLTKYISDELVDVCSEESLRQVEKMKNKLTPEDLKDIIIMMMLQQNGSFGWQFVERISRSWTDDKLENLVKLILADENYDEIGNGSDCGLFEIFPHLQNKVSIRKVIERDSDDDDSVGSLVDFIEDDLNEVDDSDDDDSDDDDSEEEELDYDDDDSDDDSEEEEEIKHRHSEKRKSHESSPNPKKRKIILIDSDSSVF